jgi:adenosylmethionine-8-amino-7-oxononanoate aminotransferase
VRDPETKEQFPAAENVGVEVREAARRKGLLLRASHWMAVLAPPLTITAEELDELLDIFEGAVTEVVGPLIAAPQPVRM